jgi:hypothetical protein
MGTKSCFDCSEVKPVSEFYLNRARGQPMSYCKDCSRSRKAAWVGDNPIRTQLTDARKRAKQAGVPFSITVNNVPPVPAVCPILGVPLERGGDRNSAPSLDRIKPELGYVPGNVAWISFRANRIKNDATLAELEAAARWLRAQLT